MNAALRTILFASSRAGAFAFVNPEAAAYVARMDVQPDPARKSLIDALFTGLKSAGLLAKLDALWLLAAHAAQAGRLNLVANAYNLTAVASPTFTTDRGYQGDGSVSYLATGFNPSTAPSPRYVRDSAHLSVWARGGGVLAPLDIGGRSASGQRQAVLSVRFTANTFVARVNQDAYDNGPANSSDVGLFVGSRTTPGESAAYRNGTLLGTVSRASTGAPTFEIFVCGVNSGGTPSSSPRPLAAASVGAGLSEAEAAALYNALNSYLVAVGAA